MIKYPGKRIAFFTFLPFLILYIIIVIAFPTSGTNGDESRYLIYAQFMFNGVLPPDFDFLANGPGYSIVLIPFVALKLPLICITLLNALLYFFSVLLLFNTLKKIISHRYALVFSLLWALYYNAYTNMPFILPETFTVFLITLLVFCTVKLFISEDQKISRLYFLLTGFTLGYIALTKPIFGYVLATMLVGVFILFMTNRRNRNYKTLFGVLMISFAVTIPYLTITYRITHKFFYWSSVGGNNLYWMSTPFTNEYGSFHSFPNDISEWESNNSGITGYRDSIEKRHGADFALIKNLNPIEQDDKLKAIAIKNIETHPYKFLKNCFANLGRILFNYPWSYKMQKPGTLLRFPPNGILLVCMMFCFIPTIIKWKRINFSIRVLLLLAFIYLGGSILGSADIRMFTIIVPILLLWMSYIFFKCIRLNLNW